MTGYNVLLRVITCYYVIRRKNNFFNEFLRISKNLICCARVLATTGYNVLLPVITLYGEKIISLLNFSISKN